MLINERGRKKGKEREKKEKKKNKNKNKYICKRRDDICWNDMKFKSKIFDKERR
jgi:hypothetical protein